jgi:capsular exopolysaccharide synthesis family protein
MPPDDSRGDLSDRRSTALSLAPAHELAPIGLVPGLAPAADESIHFRDLWHIVLKRKWALILFFLFVVVSTAIATSMMTPIYRSVISMKIERDAPKVVDYKDVTPAETYYDVDFYKTQYELLKSRTLAARVVEQLNLRPHASVAPPSAPSWKDLVPAAVLRLLPAPVAARLAPEPREAQPTTASVGSFLGSMTVEPIRNSRLLRIYYDSADPQLATDALNSLAQNFINVNLERRSEANSYAKAFLEEKIAQTKAKLEDAERQLVAFQRDHQIINVDDKQNVLAQTLSDFNSAGSRAQQERVKAQALYDAFKADPESSPQVLENKSIQALKEQRAKMQAEYEDLTPIYKPMFPKMQQMKASIDELDRRIKTEIDVIRRSVEGSYRASLEQEANILGKLEGSKKAMLDLQGRSIRYNILKRDVETYRQFYDGLLQRYKEVGVAGGIGVNNISVVDPAEVPSAPFKPNLRQNLVMAMVLGLAGGLGLVFFLEYLDDRLHRPEDMERITHLPVLGVVPMVKRTRGHDARQLAMTTFNDVRSSFAEAYRSVRTALQFSTSEGAPKRLIVTSTSAGDGKTTTALSLAINFAQTGRPVLIVDADLRNPSLHRNLGIENSKGLSNYLSSDMPATSVLQQTTIPNLSVITSGPLPPNPVELLSGPKLGALLAQCGETHAHIILDSPPVLGLADAMVLGNHVGAVLYVVASGSTKKGHVKVALKRLRLAGVTPIGTVMTKVRLADGMYGYESAYYYYGSTNDAPALPRAT